MIYEIWIDNERIFRSGDNELMLLDPVLTLEAGKAGSLEFTIPPNRAINVYRFTSRIRVYKNRVKIWTGRVLEDSLDFRKFRKIFCEGHLAIFNDTVARPYRFGGSVTDYVQLLLDMHNSQVLPDLQVELGTVTVVDSNDFIPRSDTSYPSIQQIMKDKLIGSLGGYFVMEEDQDNKFVLNYYKDSPFLTAQTIKFGENLLDITQHRSGTGIVSAVLPLGAKIEDTEDRITITDVNEGSDFVFDAEAVDAYGMIYRVEVFDNVTIPENLKTKAQERLQELLLTDISIEVKAADLSMLQSETHVDDFSIFTYVRVVSEHHGIDDLFMIQNLTINLNDSARSTMTVGTKSRSFLEEKRKADSVIREIRSDYVTNQRVTGIVSEISLLASEITQTAEAIRSEVSETYTKVDDFETYKQTVGTQFTQTSEDFRFQFSSVESTVDDLGEATQTQFEAVQSMIRLVNGNIEIGRSSSNIVLILKNDRISFQSNKVEIAYFSGSNLYITDATVVDKLNVGKHIIEKWEVDPKYTIFKSV